MAYRLSFDFRCWISVLSLLPIHSAVALYSIQCSPIPSTAFSRITQPIRDSVAAFLHSTCTVPHGKFDGNELQIATWPQYANISTTAGGNTTITVPVHGYAYALPQCAQDTRAGHELLRTLVSFMGGRRGDLNWHSGMTDFLSWSVSGAHIVLTTMEGEDVLSSRTSRYGHFGQTVNLTSTMIAPSAIMSTAVNLSVGRCGDVPPADAGPYATPPTTMEILVVAPQGLTVVTDLDDILRVAEIWNFKQALLTTFDRPFEPWLNITRIFALWAQQTPDIHFHYATDAPELLHQFYVDGIKQYFPPGSYSFRPMLVDTIAELATPRYDSIKQLIATFPHRKFVLIGDTSTSSTLSAYVRLAHEHPNVACLLIRDVSAIEPANWIVGATAGLQKLTGRYVIFNTPGDLPHSLANGMQNESESIRGCEDLGFNLSSTRRHGHGHGNLGSWIVTVGKGLSALYRCLLVLWQRPHIACPFDRRDGTWYHHGGYEPVHNTTHIINRLKDLPMAWGPDTGQSRMYYDEL